MINGHPVIAVIAARSGSKGLSGKNTKLLAGRPLLQWPIFTAKGCPYIDEILLSTDSEAYAEVGRQAGAKMYSLRPSHLAEDTTLSVPVVLDCIETWQTHQQDASLLERLIVVLLEPTSPFTLSENLTQALQKLMKISSATAIVSIADTGSANPEFCTKLNDSDFIQPFQDFQQQKAVRRQDTQPVYFYDGSFYISFYMALRELGTFYHSRTLGYKIAGWQRFEIDTAEDFVIAEAIADHLHRFKELPLSSS